MHTVFPTVLTHTSPRKSKQVGTDGNVYIFNIYYNGYGGQKAIEEELIKRWFVTEEHKGLSTKKLLEALSLDELRLLSTSNFCKVLLCLNWFPGKHPV